MKVSRNRVGEGRQGLLKVVHTCGELCWDSAPVQPIMKNGGTIVVINQTIRCTNITTLHHVVGQRTDTFRHTIGTLRDTRVRGTASSRALQPNPRGQCNYAIIRAIITECWKEIPFVGTHCSFTHSQSPLHQLAP